MLYICYPQMYRGVVPPAAVLIGQFNSLPEMESFWINEFQVI